MFPVLPTIAGHCVRVRVKLGSARRGLRAATSFANRIRDWNILGSLDDRLSATEEITFEGSRRPALPGSFYIHRWRAKGVQTLVIWE